MNQFEVGQLAQELNRGYLAFAASVTVMQHPYTVGVVERLERENTGPAVVPIESISRKDETAHFFDLSHALRNISTSPTYREIRDRLWLAGAVLAIGDELDRAQPYYFDREPDLEFVRHLRNGVAHGNTFHFEGNQPTRPAHFTGPDQRLLSDGRTSTPVGQSHTFEITSSLEGQQVLFGFMGPGDVCDLMQFVANRLIRIGNKDEPKPL